MLVSGSCGNTHSSCTQQNLLFFHSSGRQKSEFRVGVWRVLSLPVSGGFLGSWPHCSSLWPSLTWLFLLSQISLLYGHLSDSGPTSLIRDYPLWRSLINHICKGLCQIREHSEGLPGGSVVQNPPASAGDRGSIPGSGRSPGGGHGNRFQHSGRENPRDRGAWWATVYGAAKSQT